MGDVEALSKALLRLHDDAQLRQRLGEAAQHRAADFAPGVIGPRVSAIYREVLAYRAPVGARVGGP
jgi:glycosyltransferase involved in cell wall biosynthesis